MNIKLIEKSYMEKIHNFSKGIKQRIENLKNEERIDEANFEKIRLNVVGIFTKMFSVSMRKVYTTENKSQELIMREEFKKVYLDFFMSIPKTWYESLEKAIVNNDSDLELIERIKIKTMEEIKRLFIETWEE